MLLNVAKKLLRQTPIYGAIGWGASLGGPVFVLHQAGYERKKIAIKRNTSPLWQVAGSVWSLCASAAKLCVSQLPQCAHRPRNCPGVAGVRSACR
ncbi:MAG: hypothetical protein JSS01_11745 [Proteobacteria bacterium]|nr:hypothetical protein [Pseudomonadota bacterium]